MNPFTDKYFSKSRIVAEETRMNPRVSYRIFGRSNGIAALEPAAALIRTLAPMSDIDILPTGTEFKSGDTMMIVKGFFQNIVELETLYLQWCALPCYCAYHAKAIVNAADGKPVLDFSARHLYGAESVALASYGGYVGGIRGVSTDTGAEAQNYLSNRADDIRNIINQIDLPSGKGIGTTPHALIAIFRGDYIKID